MAVEEENKTGFLGCSAGVLLRSRALWVGVLAGCYLAVLPMAHTMALRNVALLLLFVGLAGQFSTIRSAFQWDWPVILWAAYLIGFPLIAHDHAMAWQSLGGQWGRGLLAMLAGAGTAALIAQKHRGTSFCCGVISSVPVMVHLALLLWKGWTLGSIPWGDWGRESHHADLGYAAGQAVVLLSASIFSGQARFRVVSVVLIFACFLSTALAASRAGLIFCLVGGLFVCLFGYLFSTARGRVVWLTGLLVFVLAGVGFLFVSAKEDVRWRHMASELLVGFYGDPVQIQCQGTISVEPQIIARYGPGDTSQRLINSLRGGDGARVLVLRAGLALALQHPWGVDGSRQAYQKLLALACASPAIAMAHTHNGWLDTLLAIGWIGALLYLWVLLHFFWMGLSYLRRSRVINAWALVLVAISAFWILRGLTDSVFRDHMLEMQGFILAFAAVALRLQTQTANRPSHAPQPTPQVACNAG